MSGNKYNHVQGIRIRGDFAVWDFCKEFIFGIFGIIESMMAIPTNDFFAMKIC